MCGVISLFGRRNLILIRVLSVRSVPPVETREVKQGVETMLLRFPPTSAEAEGPSYHIFEADSRI